MNVKKLGEKRYRLDYRDHLGRRHRKLFEKRGDADSAAANIRKKLDNGTFVSPKDLPTFEVVARSWFESKTRSKRPATLRQWRVHIDNHLLDPDHGFKGCKLKDVTIPRIETFRDRMIDKGLAAPTVNKILTTGRAIFAFAIRQNQLGVRNPFDLAEKAEAPPVEVNEDTAAPREGMAVRRDEVLNLEEVRRLLEKAKEGFYRTLFQFIAMTGARHDEALALRWSDIDFDAGKVTICRSLCWEPFPGEKRETPRFFPPKTAAGHRTIPVPPDLVRALKLWKLACPPGELGLVFPTKTGTPQRRNNILRRGFYPALEAAKLRHVTVHSLRHSYASMLIDMGAPLNEVSGYLGHANCAITASTYTHFLRKQDSAVVNQLGAALFSEKKQQVG